MIEIHNLTPDELTNKLIARLEALLIGNKKEVAMSNKKIWWTRKETSDYIKVSLVTLNSWSKKGIISAYKIGNQVRYKKNEVEKSLIKM